MKKSQAVAEFIQVYGIWLVILIVGIAFLAYYGVLDPKNFLPDAVEEQCKKACREKDQLYTGYTPKEFNRYECHCKDFFIMNHTITWGDTSD